MHRHTLDVPEDLFAEIESLRYRTNGRRTETHMVAAQAHQAAQLRARATGIIPPGGIVRPVTPAEISRTACLLSLLRVGLRHATADDLAPISRGRPAQSDVPPGSVPPKQPRLMSASESRAYLEQLAAKNRARSPELVEPVGPELVEPPAPRRKRAKPAK